MVVAEQKSEQRMNIYSVDPCAAHVETDEGQPYYDPRVKLPLDKRLVESIKRFGCFKSVVLTRHTSGSAVDGMVGTVVAGRQTILAAREANAQLLAEGREAVRVPVIFVKEDEATLAGIMVAENELRRDDDIITSAEKVGLMQKAGATDADIEVAFGLKADAIKNRVKLLRLGAKVKAAIRSGKIGSYAALGWCDLSIPEQEAALEQALATGVSSRRDLIEQRQATGATAAKVGGKKKPRTVPKKRLYALCKWATKEQWLTKEARLLLEWVLGQADDDDAKRINGFGAFLDRETNAKAAKKKKAAKS